MKRTLIFCVMLLLNPLLMAVEINVGTTRLSIEPPSGFSPITNDMQPYADLAKRFVPPTNDQFALFIPDADAAAAAQGEIPETERMFYVQATKEMGSTFVTTADFAGMKRLIKAQNDKLCKDVKSRASDFIKDVDKGMSEDFDANLDLSLEQIRPFPPHHETERCVSFSALITYKINDDNGNPSIFEGVITTTFVHIQGKMLCLYTTAEKSGLDWSRAESRKWADAVIAANPSTGEIAARESKSSRKDTDWSRTIGGIVGGILVALVLFMKRKSDTKIATNQAITLQLQSSLPQAESKDNQR